MSWDGDFFILFQNMWRPKFLSLFFCLFVAFAYSSSASAQEAFEDQLKRYDREDIHSIHKRLYTKVGRHEITGFAGGIFNNNGYALVGAQYQYHFFEALGFEAAAGGFGFQTGDDDRLSFFQSSLSFSPIYGKISWFTWAVLNFDLYAVGGAGVVSYSGLQDGTSIMGNVGLGTRVFINEFLAAKVEFRDYIYERDFTNNDSEILHNYSLVAGVSVFIPFTQDL